MNASTAIRPASSTGLAAIPLRKVSNVKELLMNDMAKQQLATVAASQMKPERMMRLIANAARTTPKLMQCDPMSLLGGLMQCASLGLEPNTVLGHAYLIPFDNNRKVRDPDTGREQWKKITEVQLVVGYKGLIDLARRSGHITSLSANIHYSDDELWEYEEGTESTLRHRPGSQEGKKLHAYAIAKFKDGGHAYVVLPWAKVMKIRDGSQGWQSAVKFGKTENSPWAKHEDEMAKKTAIRALAKYLPLSIEFMDAVQVDGARADYAQFAMQPIDGVAIEQSDDDEGDGFKGQDYDEETGEVSRIEDRRGVDQTIDQPAQDKAVAAAPKRRSSAAKQQDQQADQQAKDEAPSLDLGAVPSENPEIAMLVDRVREWAMADIMDGADVESTLVAYGDQLANIAKQDGPAHDALVVEIRKAAKG